MKRKNESKVKTSVMVPKEIMALLKAEARRTHRTVSGMITEITVAYFVKADR